MAWYSGYQHPYQGFFWTWSNEKAHSGIDLPASCGTPMTAILPGQVIIAGQYPCYGGQVSIRSMFGGVPIVYTYLHGGSHTVNVGQHVGPGQLIGYSGAPISAACGGGCHIHFEVEHGTQAPYTGGPPQNSSGQNYPINPVPLLAYAAGNSLVAIGSTAQGLISGKSGSRSGSTRAGLASSTTSSGINNSALTDTLAGTTTSSTPFDWGSFLSGIGGFIANPASILQGLTNPATSLQAALAGLGEWVGNPIRLAKLIVGVGLIAIALIVLVLPTAAPILAGAGTAAAGAPEAAPAVYSATRSVTHRRRRGEPRSTPPAAGETVPAALVSVQRSYTTRRLGRQQRATATSPIGQAPQPAQASQSATPTPSGLTEDWANFYRSARAPNVPPTPTPAATTTTNAQGKRTMRTPIVPPTSGPPASGVQRMVPATGPSIPSKPPRSRNVPAKPKASYTAPTSVQRAATKTTPLRAPTTAPLKGNQSPGTGYWMTPQEAQRGRAAGMGLYRNLKPGQSVVVTPRRERKQSQMSIEELQQLPASQLTPSSKTRLRRGKRSATFNDILRDFRQEKNT